MKGSKFAEEFHQAQELEKGVEQMFNYAENPNFVEAACYFMKGAEALKNAYLMMALADEEERRESERFIEESSSLLDKMLNFIGLGGGAV